MLEAYVGQDAFRTGVRRLHRQARLRQHGHRRPLDRDRQGLAARKITGIAHDFTLQAGVPLISAVRKTRGLTLTQSRFGADAASKTPRSWRTPVVVAGLGGTPAAGGDRRSPTVIAAGPTPRPCSMRARPAISAAIIPPSFGRGSLAGSPSLGADDQLGLIYDSAALGQAGYVAHERFPGAGVPRPGGGEPIVLQALAQQLSALDALYDGQPGQPAYRAFARARLAPAFTRLGWDAKAGEADNDVVLRTTLITTLGRLDDPAVVAEARRRFTASLAAPANLTGSFRQAVLRIVASHADAETWEALHGLARAATDITDKTRLYHDLGLSHDPALADRALALALSGEPSATDVPELISGVAEVYPDKAFAFALAHRAAVDAALEPTSRPTSTRAWPVARRIRPCPTSSRGLRPPSRPTPAARSTKP